MINSAISRFLLISSVAFTAVGNSTASLGQDNQDRTTIRRVKRPVFTEQDWKKIYFENLFEEGLAGARPERVEPVISKGTIASATENTALSDWSEFVSREAIEDEIKSIHSQLQAQLTTRGRFNSQIGEIRQHFNMLSMLFGIVSEFNQDIRWKEHARGAQMAFATAAERAQSPSESTFAIAVQRQDELTDLIRGGTVTFAATPSTPLDWPAVIDRRPIMVRLDEALQSALKPATSNRGEFEKQLDLLSQQTNLVSALAQVLVQDSMDDTDDDGYVRYSRALGTAAADLLTAIENRDFERASRSVNAIDQSCNDCHGEWR